MGPANKRSVRTQQFRYLQGGLPGKIRALADQAFALFETDPNHPMLGRHDLKDTAKGQHKPGSFAVSVTQKYRAIGIELDDRYVWYWIGTHNDYENFTGRK